jgi:hypothetical protein
MGPSLEKGSELICDSSFASPESIPAPFSAALYQESM